MTDEPQNEEAKALGRRLREAREQSHLPQDAVAPVIGVPRSAISDIELGKRGVDALELRRLAELYEVDVETLLYDATEGNAAKPWAPLAVYRDRKWRRLPKVLEILADESDAYERDGSEAIDVGSSGPSAGTPNLGVWLRADDDRYAGLPLFEVTLTAGPLRVRVFAGAHRDVLGLLRELSPIVKDMHLAQLASQLGSLDRAVDVAALTLKAAES